ncbi:MAG: AsmA-like C-terminal domain-containing protein [Sulfurimonas sp.]|nr:AsmA-like C-terminal domain-containing protein [Sulfurimonas sp.]
MNDNTINSIISTIQFIIITILSFISLLLLTIFLFLQHGIFIQNISFANVNAEKLYIKWDEKIRVHVKEITIAKTDDTNTSLDEYQALLASFKPNLAYLSLFQDINIDKITFNDFNIEFKYSEADSGFIKLSSPQVKLEGIITSDGNLFHLLLKQCDIINKDIKINGNIVFNTQEALELTTALEVYIQNETKLNLYTHSNRDIVHYAIESEQKIKNIKQIVRLLGLDPELKYWVDDAIVLSSFELQALYGSLEYKKMEEAYLNLHAKAVANDLIYTYDKKVAPIRTKTTDLEFKDGVLFIRPKNAYSYDFFLDKSWLKIDFTKKEELLTLYLLFKGQVNKDLLNLLNRYEITLPFIQTKGMIDTNLTLDINLMTSDVEAIGDFYAKESQINYLGLDIDILDAHVALKNSDVKVKNMKAAYKNIATAYVDLDLRAKESRGTLDFRFDTISFKDENLSFLSDGKPLNITYFIDEKQDYLKIAKSKWNYKEHVVEADATKVLFDIQNLQAKIPSTKIQVGQIASVMVAGDISFESQEASFDLALLTLDYLGFGHEKAASQFKATYEKGNISLLSKKPFSLILDTKSVDIKNIAADISEDVIELKSATLAYNDSIKANLSAKYNRKNGLGTLSIHKFLLQNETFGEILTTDETTQLFVENRNNTLHINSKEYGFKYLLDDTQWLFEITSLKQLAQKSELLQKHALTNGYFKAQKKRSTNDILFWLSTNYKHKILVEDNKPIESYSLVGTYNTKVNKTRAKINDVIEIDIQDTIKIKADNLGINIDEVINIFDDNTTEEETQESPKEEKEEKSSPIYIEMSGCYLFLSENRNVISDTIYFEYINDTLRGELKHQKGRANFLLKEKKFHLHGENFNEFFMEKLFAHSKFRGGSMEFYISGPLKEYDGTIHIKDTTILDYKILNNVLAFVNTVPSLITFSLPGYDINGIKAKEAYTKFKFQDEIYKISDVYLSSKEIEIVGSGEASIKENSINLDLNLKTQLGSSFSKIPLIGHILLGNETVSTSLHVTGALDDPDVKTQVAKDIAVAPFNIIKRTLMYPFEIFRSEEKK